MKKIFIMIIFSMLLITNPKNSFAADGWTIAAEALGVFGAYHSTLNSLLTLGNDASAQVIIRQQDIKKNGADQNRRDIELVDAVMNQLINHGKYELRINSLPFIWAVNNSEKLNASCYPVNYISINRGLVQKLNFNKDQLAAVLAHEMIHGIEQHAARNYAKAIAQKLGALTIGANLNDDLSLGGLSVIVDYSIAKNINVPAEYEADEKGFYLMTSAGFNPGGGAAVMNQLNYYLNHETQDFLEFNTDDEFEEQIFNDHPDTERREKKLGKLLTDYSIGHITVENFEHAYKVFIDGIEILHSENIGGAHNAAEDAYYFAGGLAQAFHDFKNVDDWNFHRDISNQMTFLTDNEIYNKLKELSATFDLSEKIQVMVERAYQNEKPKTRQKFYNSEIKRENARKKIKEKALKSRDIEKLKINADIYNEYGEGELALKEITRALKVKNPSDDAECLAICGRAKALCGDFESAFSDVNAAIEKNPNNSRNLLNRGEIYYLCGEINSALRDVETALLINEKDFAAYRLQGKLFNELGEFSRAEESYRRCYELNKKNPQLIPEEYLMKIDSEVANKIYKENPQDET